MCVFTWSYIYVYLWLTGQHLTMKHSLLFPECHFALGCRLAPSPLPECYTLLVQTQLRQLKIKR